MPSPLYMADIKLPSPLYMAHIRIPSPLYSLQSSSSLPSLHSALGRHGLLSVIAKYI